MPKFNTQKIRRADRALKGAWGHVLEHVKQNGTQGLAHRAWILRSAGGYPPCWAGEIRMAAFAAMENDNAALAALLNKAADAAFLLRDLEEEAYYASL